MKIFLSVILCFFSLPTQGHTQTTITTETGVGSFEVLEDSVLTFPPVPEIHDRFIELVELDGIAPNRFVSSAGVLRHAAAILFNNRRYVVYNQDFIRDLESSCGESAVYFLLAHEIGHHFAGHTFEQGDRHQEELEADYFAGRKLEELNRLPGKNIDIDEARCALTTFAPEEKTQDHPERYKRLAALAAGFDGVPAALQNDPFPEGLVFSDCDVFCPEMVVIPAGVAEVGSRHSDPETVPDEKPVQRVSITKFALGRTEITKRQFMLFAEENGVDWQEKCLAPDERADWREIPRSEAMRKYDSSNGADPDDVPISCIRLWDALDFVAWLNSKVDGDPYRLPSEAELEYAMRVGSRSVYPWGDTLDDVCEITNGPDEHLNRMFNGQRSARHLDCLDGYPGVYLVAQFPPNPFGLFDIDGNLSEFTADCYSSSLLGLPLDGSARVQDDCIYRTVKGGNFIMPSPTYMRAAFRKRVAGSDTRIDVGIRVARDLDVE